MEQPTSQADFLSVWQLRLNALEVNINELQHLDSRRLRLQEIREAAVVAHQDQGAATAAKQEASRRLEALLAEGRTVMTFLNAGIREHYGKDSEKLAEFKLQPFRGRRSKVAVPTLPPAPPLPEDAR
ncbi:MAG TPA: hypothetical protein VF179_15040 [Thermoanaerobaculia bacterium]|nr:hypothetical protein [Thermoanaerobaculia bacterium]